MATASNVLGSIFVNLYANTAEYVAGLTKAAVTARATGREIESSFSRLGSIVGSALAPLGAIGQQIGAALDVVGQKAGQAFASVGKASAAAGVLSAVSAGAGIAAGALAVGLFEAATHAAEFGAKIFEAHEKTGLSAASLSGLAAVTKQMGGNFDNLVNALGRATVNFEKTATAGGKTNAELYRVMGGAKGIAELGLKPLDDQIQIVLKRTFEMNDTWARNRVLSELLGKGWQANIEVLSRLAEDGFVPAIELAKKFGIYYDDEHAAQAHIFVAELAGLKAELLGVANTIGIELIPRFSQWLAQLHTVNYDVELLKIGLKAQALSMTNFAGINDKALDELATKATDVVTAQHAAMQKYIEDMKKLGRALQNELAGGGGGGAPAKTHKTDLERMAESSAKFWERYNAGLADAAVRTPPVTRTIAQLADAATAAAAAGYKNALALDTYRESLDHMMAAGTKGAVAAYPFAPSLAAPTAAPMPFSPEEFSGHMNRIMQAPPAVKASLNTVRAHFEELFNTLTAEGRLFGPRVFSSFFYAIDGVSTELTKLVVTGKSSFRELFQSFVAEITKASLQNLFGRLFAPIAAAFGGAPASARPSSPTGVAAGGFLSSFFGGFLAAGGDVTPGRAYVVGEHHPEFFVPKQTGQIRPALSLSGPQTNIVNNFNGVRDLDLFRRSESQIMTQFHRQSAIAYGRS